MKKKIIYYSILFVVVISAIIVYKKIFVPTDMSHIVYEHYKNDSLKLEAATFLIDNMKWHTLNPTLVSYSEHIQQVIEGADSVYKFITQGLNNENLTSGPMGGWLRHRAKQYSVWRDTTFKFPEEHKPNLYKQIDADFLIRHIDNSFERWETSPYAQGITFPSFCEYILPFQALNTGGYLLNGDELYKEFAPHLDKTHPTTLPHIVTRYANYISHIRNFTATNQTLPSVGWRDIFFKKNRDCIPQCDVECNVLRAMGVPIAIDMNIGNREFVGRHHHCVVLDKNGKEYPFHGEREISKTDYWGYVIEYKLNVYRHLYGAQSDSPYLLRRKGEALPSFFKTPTLKDVTNYIKPITKLTLNIPKHIPNNLTWLYSYSRANELGIQAITWGINDTVNSTSSFQNVVKNMLYFPAYLDTNETVHFISDPIVVMNGLNYNEIHIDKLSDYCVGNKDTVQDIIMTRKFPRKANMIKEAQNMFGGIWYGAQHRDGRDKVKLAEIDFVPEAHLQEIKIKKPKAYKFYIFETANKLTTHIGEIEFLTETKLNYKNIKPATPLPILSSEEIKVDLNEQVQVLPRYTKRRDSDGNQQTAISGSVFRYEFIEPQVITSIVFAPVNAENSIEPNEDYQLFQWNEGWQEITNVTSKFNFLEFKQLDTRKLYWLKNNSRGQEEVPFIITNNRPQFIYYECVKPQVIQDHKIFSFANYSCIASSEEPEEGPYEPGYTKFLFDSDTTNFWHSRYTGTCPSYPHWLEIDTRNIEKVDGFIIKLRSRENKPKLIKVSGSINKKEWQEIGTFELKKINQPQSIYFRETMKIRYLKINVLSGQNKERHTGVMYIKLFQNK